MSNGFPYPSQQGRRPMFGRPQQGPGSAFKMRIILALVVALFAVISYYGKPGDVNPVTGESERVALANEEDEVQLGLQAAPEMVMQFGGPSQDVEAQQLVQTVGWQVLQGLQNSLDQYNKEHPEGPKHTNPYLDDFNFTLLADRKTVNAFALPGGQIFITEALFAALETHGQLAGVLGHEIGHVISRHSNKQMARQGMFSGIAGAVGVLGGDANSARMGQMIASAIGMKYGREAETESDDWAVRLTAAAGYDPRAMLGVMKVLDEATGRGGGPPEFLSTHPKPANRAEYIQRALKKYFPDGVPEGLKP